MGYKHGVQYNLAQRFMLAWPYGDAVRIMSSYAWTEFNNGPPGAEFDSLRTYTPVGVKCRDTPTTSPVTPEWDADEHSPWACEHRWQGVLPLIRFRKLTMGIRGIAAHTKWHDENEEGIIGYSLGSVAFVALSRGWNWYTGMGLNETYNLTGRKTPLAEGSYCNLAAERGPLPTPQEWGHKCDGQETPITVDINGTITFGELQSGSMVVLHANYTERRTWNGEDFTLDV